MNPRFVSPRIRLFLLVAMTLLSPRLFAQATASGNIQGTVVDQSQAVVAGAEVVLTNLANGSARTTTTNDSGIYRFELLSAGNYTAKINAKGFSTVEVKLELLVGQTATGNATLTPGSTSQTVQVSAVNPIVDLNKTSVSKRLLPLKSSTSHSRPRRGQPRLSRARRQSRRLLRPQQEPLRHPLRQRCRRP